MRRQQRRAEIDAKRTKLLEERAVQREARKQALLARKQRDAAAATPQQQRKQRSDGEQQKPEAADSKQDVKQSADGKAKTDSKDNGMVSVYVTSCEIIVLYIRSRISANQKALFHSVLTDLLMLCS